MNARQNNRRGVLVRAAVLGAVCCSLLACATTYRICLPNAAECSEVTSYRKIGQLDLNVTPEGGVTVTMTDVDRQTASPLEQAAADAIRRLQVPQ